MKFKIVILLFFQICFLVAESQNLKFAHQIIDTLCSPYFHGRAYDFDANSKTSEFLKNEFINYKLKKFNNSYFQYFTLSANTFNGEMSLISADSVFIPGVDFILSGFSSGISGKFPIKKVFAQTIKDSISSIFKTDNSQCVIYIDTVGLNDKTFDKIYQQILHNNLFKARGIITKTVKIASFVPSMESKKFIHIQITEQASRKLKDSISLNIENKLLQNFPVKNILGYIQGKSDTCIVISAHYDHIGHLGKSLYFPGANDNASGVTMVLSLAKYFADQKIKPEYTIVFMLFAGEELGILGSKYYTENPVFPLSKIKFLLNLDMIGTGEKGIQMVNSSIFTNEYQLFNSINSENNYVSQIKKRGAAANSDHYCFFEKSVKCFFIYTLGDYTEYHNINDNSANIPLNKFENVFYLVRDFITKLK